MKTTLLRTYSQVEVYNGTLTGRTVWRAEEVNTHCYSPFASVLGRGDSEAQAIADWNQRAQADGHCVQGVKLPTP